MNFAEMILPASSDNSQAEIRVIREDVIDKILVLVSTSMPSQIICWQGIQIDFVMFGTKPEFIKVVITKLEQEKASGYVYAITKPLSRKQRTFTACKRPCSLKEVLLCKNKQCRG